MLHCQLYTAVMGVVASSDKKNIKNYKGITEKILTVILQLYRRVTYREWHQNMTVILQLYRCFHLITRVR